MTVHHHRHYLHQHAEAEIKQLQTFLDTQGYNIGPTGVDGVAGNYTKKAVNEFLAAKGIKVTNNEHSNIERALDAVQNPADHSDPAPGSPLTTQADASAQKGGLAGIVDTYRHHLIEAAKQFLHRDNKNHQFGPDHEWCATFLDKNRERAAHHLGVTGTILPGNHATPDNASEFKVVEHARAIGAFHDISDARKGHYEIKPGDTVCIRHPREDNALAGHVATVLSVDYKRGTVETIAGNAAGGRVECHTYSLNHGKIEGIVDEGAVFVKAALRHPKFLASLPTTSSSMVPDGKQVEKAQAAPLPGAGASPALS